MEPIGGIGARSTFALLGAASATSPFAEPTSGAVDSGMHRTWLLLCLAVIACAYAQSLLCGA